MNLNTIRLEGKIEDDHFLDLCDRKGILVMAGWCCCDHWERWRNWKSEDHVVARESLRDQIRRLRSHPSVFDWLNGSDNPPPPGRREGVPRRPQGVRLAEPVPVVGHAEAHRRDAARPGSR